MTVLPINNFGAFSVSIPPPKGRYKSKLAENVSCGFRVFFFAWSLVSESKKRVLTALGRTYSPKTTTTRMSQFRGQARVQIKRLAWLMTAPPLSTESASVALRWSGLSEASRLSALRTGRPTVRLSSSLADWTSSLPKLDAPLRCSW